MLPIDKERLSPSKLIWVSSSLRDGHAQLRAGFDGQTDRVHRIISITHTPEQFGIAQRARGNQIQTILVGTMRGTDREEWYAIAYDRNLLEWDEAHEIREGTHTVRAYPAIRLGSLVPVLPPTRTPGTAAALPLPRYCRPDVPVTV